MLGPVSSQLEANSSDYKIASELSAGIVRRSMFWTPERQATSEWFEHVPFAFWLVDVVRPRVIVELGTQNGVSYSAMCQAVKSLDLGTSCFAVDTWSGDQHAGLYSESVYHDFSRFHDQHYRFFSRLVRSTFDDALKHFEDRTVDLLHIDGLHTYEAVRHDYESWLPKLSPNAVVLFHDTNVRENNFGVFRLWSAVSRDRLNFNFLHGHGLGVLGMGGDYSPALLLLFGATGDHERNPIREMFAALGSSLRFLFERTSLERSFAEREQQLEGMRAALAERDIRIAALNEAVKKDQSELRTLERMLIERNEELLSVKTKAMLDQQRVAALGTELMERHVDAANPLELFVTQKATAGSSARFLPAILAPLLQKLRKWRAERLVARSGLFDRDWYLTNYPDVAEQGVDPIRHYLAFGANEGRHPSPAFSGTRYLESHPDVAASGMNPLLHFILYGRREGRNAPAATELRRP
jgi:hypothetical protein